MPPASPARDTPGEVPTEADCPHCWRELLALTLLLVLWRCTQWGDVSGWIWVGGVALIGIAGGMVALAA